MKRWLAAVAAAACLAGTSLPAAAGDAGANGLVVKNAWARATPPGAGVGAAYVTIVGGARADRLVSARTGVASMTQVHAVTESAGMAQMRETGGVDIPAGQTVVLAPGGLHLMLMDLTSPLVAGQRFELTLVFAHAGDTVVEVVVIAPDRAPPTAR